MVLLLQCKMNTFSSFEFSEMAMNILMNGFLPCIYEAFVADFSILVYFAYVKFPFTGMMTYFWC